MQRALLLLLPALVGGPQQELPKPTAVFDLPVQLTEVSGLTDVDEGAVACLQDEEATLYIISLKDGRIRERHPFGPPGDMEGLTRVKNTYFALRSDGLIYQLRSAGNAYVVSDSFHLQLPNNNIEGLGYDERSGHVLVAPKDAPKGDPSVRDQRDVFAFDPVTHKLLPAPVLSYSVDAVLRAAERRGIELPVRTTPKGKQVPMIKFRMASIAVDPRTGHYFILSAADHSLLVLDRQGAFVALHLLDPKLLPKPEGITFLANGEMIITSEGKGAPPRLVRYPRQG